MKRLLSLLVIAFFACAAPAFAETQTYKDGDTVLEGYLARSGKYRNGPAVLVVHQWKGLGDYEKRRADMLAELGYHAFAIDMYGQGVRPETAEEAGRLAGLYKADPALARRRLQAAIDHVKALPEVNGQAVVVIGYCFGGTMALESARAGAALAGVASFHGGLSTPAPATEPGSIRTPIRVYHGADDPHVPPAEVAAFEAEMQKAQASYKLIAYPGAVHSFTDPGAGNDPTKGAAYNKTADEASWVDLQLFLREILPAP